MSLVKLIRNNTNNKTASYSIDMCSAYFYQQIIPAYKNGEIEADEIYTLALEDAPVIPSGLKYWNTHINKRIAYILCHCV